MAATEIAAAEHHGDGGLLVVCEHASNALPPEFGDLRLAPGTVRAHVAWDPGALALARVLAKRMCGTLIHATVSRLYYDLNRPPRAPDAIPVRSELYEIPGNRLDAAGRAARITALYRPWCAALDRLIAASAPRALVTVHSFTPVYYGRARDTRIGILHGRDARLADALLAEAKGLGWQRNLPYGPEDGVLHTVERFGERNGLLTAMIEVRNDLLADAASAARIADDLARVLGAALARLGAPAAPA